MISGITRNIDEIVEAKLEEMWVICNNYWISTFCKKKKEMTHSNWYVNII